MSKIKIIAGSLLLATVLFAETKVVSLSTGWNLVGNLDMNITELRTAANDSITDVAAPGFSFKKAFVSAFGEYDGTYQTFQKFEESKGYWIKIDSTSESVTFSSTTIEQPPETPSLDDNTTSGLSTPPSVPGV